MIRLKGNIDWEITRFGVKEGDIIRNHTQPGKNKAISFDVRYYDSVQSCAVWPENYDIITEEELIKEKTNFYTDIQSLRNSALSYSPVEYKRISRNIECPICKERHQEITVKWKDTDDLIEILKFDCSSDKII